jgi:hypothetical protein
MKTTLLTVLFLIAFVTLGADKPVPSNAPPAAITGVSAAKDGRTLISRYELSGRSHRQRVAFTNEITDFRYCHWLGGRGIAVVASTSTDEFYYATLYLTGHDVSVSPVKIPAPASKSRLLGIANTGGDSIVITAVQHRRGDLDRLTGWMFIDNCPPIGPMTGLITTFDIPVEPSDTSKKP